MHLLSSVSRRGLAVFLALLVLLSAGTGVVAADPVAAGTVVVESGETVGDLEAFAGDVVVRGTVDGDLTAFAGNVRVAPGGTVTGSLTAFAGSVAVDGEVRGDARVAAETISLGPTAVVAGDLTYDGRLVQESGATVAGATVRDDSIAVGPTAFGVEESLFASWVVTVYGFFANLLLGVVLLALFPGFSRRVADRVSGAPLRSGGVGFLALVALPVVLVALAITIVGIPLTILGAVLFALVAWVASVYGGYAVGAWLLSLADVTNRWAGMLVGLTLVALVGFVPILGGLVQFAVFLLGLGALALVGYGSYRGRSPGSGTEAAPGGDVGGRPA